MKQPSLRPAIFVLLSLALSAPTLANVLNGSDSAVQAGLHLGAAVLISWAGVAIVSHLVDSYRLATTRALHHHARHDAPRSAPPAEAPPAPSP